MTQSRPSLLSSGLRSLFITAFAVIGVFLGLIPVMILSMGIGGGQNAFLPSHTTPTILPDAAGQRKALQAHTPLILTIDIKGLIGGGDLEGDDVEQILQESQETPIGPGRIKAIMLRISSPGGTVPAANAIYTALKHYKAKYQIPIYAYVDGVCASGALYAAATADRVYSSETSLIGSVGVFAPPVFNFYELMEKMGIAATNISAGKDKLPLNPTRPLVEGEEESLQNLVDYYYEHFVNLMVSNRPQMDRDRLVQEYGARVFPAAQALERGYIDVVDDDYSHSLKALAAAAELQEGTYQVIGLQKKNWIGELFAKGNPLLKGHLVHQVDAPYIFDSKLYGHFLYLYHP